MKVRTLVTAAVFIALTFAVTRFTVIPIPATKGFFNLGEVVIYVAAIALGPIVGMLVGGIGSALADLVVAPQFAPFTLVIKGIEGYVVGRLAGETSGSRLRATIIGGACMVLGYFGAEVLFAGVLGLAPTRTAAVAVALTEVPFNIVQVAVGVAVAVPTSARLAAALRESRGG
ncbi:MAG: ECF transporter S component [Armatimonadota bacterium]